MDDDEIPLKMKKGRTWVVTLQRFQPIPGTDPPQPDPTRPVDITGYTAKVQVKRDVNDPGEPMLSLTSPVGVTVNGPQGRVDVRATPAQTALVAAGRWVWECEITNGADDIITLGSGPLTVTAQVIP